MPRLRITPVDGDLYCIVPVPAPALPVAAPAIAGHPPVVALAPADIPVGKVPGMSIQLTGATAATVRIRCIRKYRKGKGKPSRLRIVIDSKYPVVRELNLKENFKEKGKGDI